MPGSSIAINGGGAFKSAIRIGETGRSIACSICHARCGGENENGALVERRSRFCRSGN
jgi:hypothetical protein